MGQGNDPNNGGDRGGTSDIPGGGSGEEDILEVIVNGMSDVWDSTAEKLENASHAIAWANDVVDDYNDQVDWNDHAGVYGVSRVFGGLYSYGQSAYNSNFQFPTTPGGPRQDPTYLSWLYWSYIHMAGSALKDPPRFDYHDLPVLSGKYTAFVKNLIAFGAPSFIVKRLLLGELRIEANEKAWGAHIDGNTECALMQRRARAEFTRQIAEVDSILGLPETTGSIAELPGLLRQVERKQRAVDVEALSTQARYLHARLDELVAMIRSKLIELELVYGRA